MKAQVLSTQYPQLDENGDRTRRYRGDVIEVSQEEFDRGVSIGVLRKPSDEPLPEPNVAAVMAEGSLPAATQPDGTPLELPETAAEEGFKAPNTHAEADALAAELGVTFPEKTKLEEKVEALEQVYAARATGTTVDAAVPENLADLSDSELMQRGVDFGHTEDEMVELSHDELVLFVAEAMGRAGRTQAQQQATVAERRTSQ